MLQNDNLPFYILSNIPKVYEFLDEVELQQFKKLQKELGKNWNYYDSSLSDPVITTLNELGYRSKTVYPTDNYYLMLGCSFTYGQHLHLRDLASNILEIELGTPVINLGILGGGCNAIALNVQKLMMSNYPKPKVIIAQWPHIYRYTIFADPGHTFLGIPQKKSAIFEELLSHDQLFETMAKNAFWYVNSLGIPVINYGIKTFHDNAGKLFEIPMIGRIDTARDNSHPGPETNKKIVEHILTELKNLE